MTGDCQQLVVAVPNLDSYHAQGGIGRVLHSLRHEWHDHVRVVAAEFDASRLPVLRNLPSRVRTPNEANLILLPQLTGAQALRNTRNIPSLVIVLDVGIVDCPDDREGIDWITHQTIARSFYGLRHASHLVTISCFTEQRLQHHLPDVADRITTIPLGVGEQFLGYGQTQSTARHILTELINHPLNTPLIIYVGSELPRKNIRLLLEAFCRVRLIYPRAQLLKVGRPGHPRWRDQTITTAQTLGLQIGEDVLILEDIDDETLAHAYRAADVFVSSSLYEGFGLPALEAMAVGTPVVVTRRGALPEVVGTSGWLADSNPADLAQMIDLTLTGTDREQRIEQGRTRARRLTWSATADAYRELMHRVADLQRR